MKNLVVLLIDNLFLGKSRWLRNPWGILVEKPFFLFTIKCSGVFPLLSLFLALIRKSQLLFRLLYDVKNSWRIPEEFCGHLLLIWKKWFLQAIKRSLKWRKTTDNQQRILQEFWSKFQSKKQLTLSIHFTYPLTYLNAGIYFHNNVFSAHNLQKVKCIFNFLIEFFKNSGRIMWSYAFDGK